MSKLLYTIPEVTEMLSIGRTRIYDLIRTGDLHSVLIGTSRRVPAAALDDFITNLERTS